MSYFSYVYQLLSVDLNVRLVEDLDRKSGWNKWNILLARIVNPTRDDRAADDVDDLAANS